MVKELVCAAWPSWSRRREFVVVVQYSNYRYYVWLHNNRVIIIHNSLLVDGVGNMLYDLNLEWSIALFEWWWWWWLLCTLKNEKGKKKNRRKTDDEWEVVVNRKLISRARGNVEKGEVKSWNEKYNGKIKINLRSKRNESTSHVSSTTTM